jgi:hypothetical protein
VVLLSGVERVKRVRTALGLAADSGTLNAEVALADRIILEY